MTNINFFREIVERFKLPWSKGAFNAYFFIIVVFFGGIGIWASMLDVWNDCGKDAYRISQNIGTYFMAIIAASLVDLNLSFKIKNVASLVIYSMACLGVACGLFYWSYNITSNYSFIFSILGILIGWLVWILANADNEKLNDSTFYTEMRNNEEGHAKNW